MELFDVKYFFECIPQIVTSLPVTLFAAFVSFLIGVLLGLITAIIKIYKVPVLKQIAGIYISAIRGTPLLVQLYIVCYGLPKLIYYCQVEHGILQSVDTNFIPKMFYALFAFSINIGAYLAEAIRSSIEAIDKGQYESSYSLGMTRFQTMTRIIIPQAFTIAIPNLGNNLISTVKDTSFIFMIGIVDVMGKAKIIGARSLSYFEVYIAVALLYWGVCFVLERIIMLTEKRSKRYIS